MEQESPRYRIALSDFKRARRKAALQDIFSRVTGHSDALIPFEEARQRLRASGEEALGLQDIPIKAIIGSVGRYADFNRNFLPRRDIQEGRWAGVKAALRDLDAMPPIQVYQIGEAYFVLDGNHRVSIAREREATHISAYVTEIHTKVPLTPETDFNDFILKAEYADFLSKTRMDECCPRAELSITAPGQYTVLEEQIHTHHHRLNAEARRELLLTDAVRHWYEDIYIPSIESIRQRGILRDFPKRTETDLYVWITKHQKKLKEELGWSVELDIATTDLVDQRGESARKKLKRAFEKIRKALLPPLLEAGQPVGEWRKKYVAIHHPGALFENILVPLNGEWDSWGALQQALLIGQSEGSHLLGLHIAPNKVDAKSDATQKIADRFKQECTDVGLNGEFALDFGRVSSVINKRARWADLVILHLAHPPQSQIASRLGSGLRDLIQRCPRPVLTVPQPTEKLENLLVAYDASPKANESLYMAAYFAGRWGAKLTVLCVVENENKPSWQIVRAKDYLEEQKVSANYIQKEGNVASAILNSVDENEIDLILMGGYSRLPVAEVILGSALDEVLRKSRKPVLICR